MGNICRTCNDELETAYSFKLKCDLLNYQSRDTAPKHALCEICGKTFGNVEALEQHRGPCRQSKSTGQTLPKKAETSKQETNFERIERMPLKYRISVNKGKMTQLKHTEKVKKALKDEGSDCIEFVCPKCEKKFLNYTGLSVHIQWHKMKKNKHKCPKCELEFLNNSILRKHLIYDH